MERTIYQYLIMLSGLILLLTLPLRANKSNGRTAFQNMIYRAYVHDRMSLWENTLQTMEFEYRQQPCHGLLYDILLARYGLIGYYLGTEKEEQAKAMLDQAEDYLDILSDNRSFIAEAKLFEAAFYGFRIGLQPWRGIQLGPRSSRLIDEALDINPSYPRGHIEKGNLLYYAPGVFGGSKSKAIKHYQQAIELMEANMKNNHRWLYLSTLVSLAEAHKETGDIKKGIAILEKALSFEPDFHWVKEEKLPEYKSY
ncbi:MAG: hypothetical protein ACLFS0_10165 [Bacteroidales bacterium]